MWSLLIDTADADEDDKIVDMTLAADFSAAAKWPTG